jgi:hypothetical protein
MRGTSLDQGLDNQERFALSATNAADPLKECDRYVYGVKKKTAPAYVHSGASSEGLSQKKKGAYGFKGNTTQATATMGTDYPRDVQK